MTTAPMSAVSVDVVPLGLGDDGVLRTAAYERTLPPYVGELALPGVLLTAGERIRDAAVRALAKVGILGEHVPAVGQLVVFDEPNRDPRGPTLSVVCWAGIDRVADPDAATWFDVGDAPRLAFDHNEILVDAVPLLGSRVWHDEAFTRALTGERFSIARALALTEALTGRAPDRGNLNRQLRSNPRLRATTERVAARGTGRPGTVWEWVTP